MNLFFDTETSGLANFKADHTHPSQPHLVQLGCVLTDDEFNIVSQMEFLIKPIGWKISDEAIAVHGITNERATAYGQQLYLVLSLFNMLCRQADVIAAHNLAFDELVMGAAFHRQGTTWRHTMPDWVCTMKASAPICRIPKARGGYKWPTLLEAHQFFCHEDFLGAHSALADAQACMRIYHAMKKHGADSSAPNSPDEQIHVGATDRRS